MVIDWFKKWASYTPNKIALKEYESNKTITYGQLIQYCELLAFTFIEQYGIQKGDRIAVIADNCIEYVALLGVSQKTGIIIAPLNYRLSANEIKYLIEVVQPKIIITEEKYHHRLEATEVSNASIILLSEIAYTSKDLSSQIIRPNIINLPLGADISDPVFIIFTSGTTGLPKGAIYTHQMMLWNSINTALRLDLTSKDRSLNCAPPFHTGGWNVLLTPFLHHGAYTLLMKSFDPSKILEVLSSEELSIWWAVPTMLKMMVETPEFENANLTNVRYFIVGGEAMPLPLIQKWHEKGIPIRQGYGLTEVGPNVTSLNEEDAIRKIGSIGKPNFYIDIKIVKEDGSPADRGESGELWLGGPCVSPGYWNHSAEEATNNDHTYFKTGDVVYRDEEDYLYVVDRIKHMYISGGENVYPAEIEKCLLQLPFIKEVAVIGVQDDKWGEVGKAFLVSSEEPQKAEKAITMHCSTQLAKYKIPKHFQFLQELPKNDAGKIDKKKLKNFV
jgi:fatty-acyl-CoA synthase